MQYIIVSEIRLSAYSLQLYPVLPIHGIESSLINMTTFLQTEIAIDFRANVFKYAAHDCRW